MRWIGVLVALWPMAAAAEGWERLDGAGVRAALEGRALVYADGTVQDFRADGRTLYGADSWGQWRVEGERYCSVWPPSDRWACYDLERDGARLRFLSDDGSETVGVYRDR
ncbi:MAG: hypothetical protein H9533_15680 [Rhodobacteraceae bacterium]|nr:hypothetical protein [Paracoccaceae bacterium]